MKKRTIILLPFIFLLTFAILFSGFMNKEDYFENTAEYNEIKEVLINYKLGNAMGGVFSSDDGTTASMSEVEIQNLIDNYNLLVDSAYAKENNCYTLYKDYNEYLLKNVHKELNDFVYVDAGVSDIRIVKCNINQTKESATVQFVSSLWFRSVSFDGVKFVPDAGTGRNYEQVELVREGGGWKVLNAAELMPWDCSCYDEESITTWISEMGSKVSYDKVFKDRKKMSSEEKDDKYMEIQRSQEILGQSFNTFAEARDASMMIDVVNGNYYAIY